MPRPKRDESGNVVPSEPKDPNKVIGDLCARVANFALSHKISQETVNSLVAEKFSTEVDTVRREQIKQLAEKLSPEQLQTLLAQAGIS